MALNTCDVPWLTHIVTARSHIVSAKRSHGVRKTGLCILAVSADLQISQNNGAIYDL